MIIQNTKSKRKLLFIVSLVVAFTVLASVIVFLVWKPFSSVPSIEQPGGTVKLSPPTNEELKESNAKKEELQKQQDADRNSEDQIGKKQLTPVITYVDQNGMNGYIPGIFEDGGVCTAKLVQGGVAFIKTSSGYKDATTTGCSPIDFVVTDFPKKGEWSLTLDYNSPNAEGTSKISTFTVK